MAKIYCKKCNERFKSMLDFQHHICLAEKRSPIWKSPQRNGKSVHKYWKKVYPTWLSTENKKHLKKIKEDKLNTSKKQSKPPTTKKNE